jgi:hypothetical protein
MRYYICMGRAYITVVETASFISAAKDCMTDDERSEAVDMIAQDPECGSLLVGGGGIRKARFKSGGKGKSGGVRVVYYYHDQKVPVFLLTVFAKKERANLSKSELSKLAKVAKVLAQMYGV